MKKPVKIISLALALSLFMAQGAQAEILITPFPQGETTESREDWTAGETKTPAPENAGETKTPVSENAGETKASVAEIAGKDQKIGPGYENLPQTENGGAEEKTNAPAASKAASQALFQEAGIEQPVIAAQAGILYDATHDLVLFEKNADEKLYPASITKLMTALVVLEGAGLNEPVTFSKTAVTNLESGAVSLGVSEGDVISVRDCLYGLLLKSANEVANGLAEHVGGSLSGFADRMNAKAASLGCTNTHFVNANGLNDPDHYTTCRDMARIAKAAFENPVLCQIASTTQYTFPATKKSGAKTLSPGHKMLYASDSRYYPGIVGGKTGYTSLAGNTLVTCVEKDGVRLIAVVLKAKSTHYADTKAMLDYGFLAAARIKNGTAPGPVAE